VIGNAGRTAGRPQQRTNEVARYPAPISGMDIRKAVGSSDLQHCVYTYNLSPFEFGLRVRDGYREWQIGIDAGVSTGVHTLIPFDSALEDNVGDKVFAVTNEGIWDVTNYAVSPVQMVVFPVQDPDVGYGTFTHYVNQAEDDVLFYADNINGLYSYDAVLEVWTNTGIITGDITEADVKFVVSHKNNVWFAARNSTVGYYLPILANTGIVTPQFFGDKFQHGGTLEGLFSWSIDGGDGVDDILVAVSHAGDVVLYAGTGPDEADWALKGKYFIGEIPNTPRFGSEQGGELYILSAYGLTSMNDLLQGVDSNVLVADMDGTSMAFKIAGLIRQDMKLKITLRGWDVALLPSEGGILISTPTIGNAAPIQYFYNWSTRGWGIWRGVPMQCFTQYEDAVFFGTADGRVMKMDVNIDNELISPPEGEANGTAIEFSILSAFNSMGSDGVYKKVSLIRPDFLAAIEPTHNSQARYDFDVAESGAAAVSANPNGGPSPSLSNLPDGIWDSSLWDQAVWESTAAAAFNSIGGSWGTGRYVAIATKGLSRSDTRLIGWDIIYHAGGPML
jgi:hypothetical protein